MVRRTLKSLLRKESSLVKNTKEEAESLKYLANALNIGMLVFALYLSYDASIHDAADLAVFALLVGTPIINMILLHSNDGSDSVFNLWLEVKKKNLRKQLKDD